MLECTTIEGFPYLPLIWLKNLQPVIPNDRISIDNVQSREQNGLYAVRSTLSITSVLTADAGEYVCRRDTVPPLPPQMIATSIAVQGELYGTVQYNKLA